MRTPEWGRGEGRNEGRGEVIVIETEFSCHLPQSVTLQWNSSTARFRCSASLSPLGLQRPALVVVTIETTLPSVTSSSGHHRDYSTYLVSRATIT